MMKKKWYVYILGCNDGSYYTGITTDLKKRLESHNKGCGAKYTRGRRPVYMLYTEACESKMAAMKTEGDIKKRTRSEKEYYMKHRRIAGLMKYRKEFPITRERIYLDHAGISPAPQRVVDAVCGFMKEASDTAAFSHQVWSERVDKVRKGCAAFIGADREEIAFVRSTSHGLSLVSEGLEWKAGDNLIVYEKEFPSNIYTWERLREKGVEMRIIPYRDGNIGVDDVARVIDRRTKLLSISSVQFTNGFRADLDALGAFCKERGIYFCVDAIQSLGARQIDVRKSNIDFLSADAHKWLLGPEGIGIFFCKRELAAKLKPALVGWKSVKSELDFEKRNYELKENALRFEEGSLNIMGICGLGAAVELQEEAGFANIEERILDLGDIVIEEAEKRGYVIHTPRTRSKRAGIVSIAGKFDLAAVRDGLRSKGIMVNVRGGGIRISPHFYNTEEEIRTCFRMIDEITR